MKAIYRLEDWGNRHHPAAVDFLRMLLGLFLLLKGCIFLQNLAFLKWMLSNNSLVNLPTGVISFIMFYVVFFHMAGGTLVMLGIITRVAALVQLPIIIAAIFTINNFRSVVNSELWLSVASGVLLLVFIVIGSGPLSLDHFLGRQEQE